MFHLWIIHHSGKKLHNFIFCVLQVWTNESAKRQLNKRCQMGKIPYEKHIIQPLNVHQRCRKYDKRNKTYAGTRRGDSCYRSSEESRRNGEKMYFLLLRRQIKSFILRLRRTRHENRLNCERMLVLTCVSLRLFWSKNCESVIRGKSCTQVWLHAGRASSLEQEKKKDTLNGKEFRPAYPIKHKTQVSSTPFAFILMGKYIIQ